MIVRESMKTCTLDYQFIGNYQKHSDISGSDKEYKSISKLNPMFIFTFNEPTAISMIQIWNFNSMNDKLENGIKKVIIRSNDKVIWGGVVKKGFGLINGIERSVTNIWLTDSIFIREQVLKNSTIDND